MTVHEDLAVQYHQQDTNYYCGAACAQMVLEQCGSGLLNQTDLYNDNHNHSTTESGWYTAPDGLTWTMNNRQSGRYFVLDALSTEDAISRIRLRLLPEHRQLVDDEQREDRAEHQQQAVERRPPPGPGQERRRSEAQETDELQEEADVRHEEAAAEQIKDLGQ